MVRTSFLFPVILCAMMLAIACESHKNKRPADEDTITADDDSLLDDGDLLVVDEDGIQPDVETMTDDTTEGEDIVPVEDDVVPVEDDIIPVEDDVVPVEDDVVPVEDDIIPAEDDIIPAEDDVVPDDEDVDLPDEDLADVDIAPDNDTKPLENPMNIPYFCQYYNSQSPASTGENSSVAMVLYAYGWNGTPDDITTDWGTTKAETPSGLAEIFNSYTGSLGVSLTPHTDGTFAEMKALIDAGKPVLVHSWFTSGGDVVVMVGYSETGYFVNDPGGVWTAIYKGGYSLYCDEAVVGKSEFYSATAFEAAIGPDGSVKYHEPVP